MITEDAELPILPVAMEQHPGVIMMRNEIKRLLGCLAECERQFQEKVAEIGRLTDAILYAHSEGFEWPSDPFSAGASDAAATVAIAEPHKGGDRQ